MNGLQKITAKTITLDINLTKKVEQIAVKGNRNFSIIVQTLVSAAKKTKASI